MGLFDKKFCDICGEKIGLLGNRKLEDGNMCKDCAKLLSPLFSDRRSSTIDEIKQQLAYREQNKIALSGFEGELSVKMRNPSWSSYHRISADAKDMRTEGDYITLTASGEEFEIKVEFDSRLVIGEATSHPTLGDLPWKERRWVSGFGVDATVTEEYTSACPEHYLRTPACVIHKGPLLLCRTKLIGNIEEEMFGEHRLTLEHRCISCERVDSPKGVNLTWILKFSDGNSTLEYKVCDYASGTNFMTLDKKYHSIFF